MQTGNSIFYGTVLLTGSNLLLRLILMSFQVFLSGRIGAAGMGLLQLTFSLKELAFTLGSAGIRTCAVYLTAESLGRGRAQDARAVLRGCFRYALALGSLAALGLWHFAPLLAESWVGDRAVLPALRICALFLPLRCLGSVLDAYCTSLGRIRELIFVEFLEQGCSMAVTVFFLARESGMDSGQAVPLWPWETAQPVRWDSARCCSFSAPARSARPPHPKSGRPTGGSCGSRCRWDLPTICVPDSTPWKTSSSLSGWCCLRERSTPWRTTASYTAWSFRY